MSSDPFGSLVSSVVRAANAGAAAVKDVADGAVNAATDFVNSKTEDLGDISKAAKSGNLVGAYFETLEAFSFGEQARDALDAVGLLPSDDKVLGEVVSGVVNYLTGNPLAMGKDIVDVLGELTKAPKQKGVPPAPSQSTPPPSTEKGKGSGKTHFPPATGTPRPPQSVLDGMNDMMKGLFDEMKKLVGDGRMMPPSTSTSPPVARPAPGNIRLDIPERVRKDFDENPVRTGGPVLGKPLSEISFDDIFADKSLSFEDMLFLFMSKVGADLKQQMEEQMKAVADLDKRNKGEGAGGAGTTTGPNGAPGNTGEAGKPGKPGKPGKADQAMAAGMPDILGALSDPGTLRGLVSGGLDLAKVLAPVVLPVIGTAVGTIAGPGPGNFIGGLAGGVGGAALAIGIDMLKGAVDAGAFDGVIEGALSLFGGGEAEKAQGKQGAAKSGQAKAGETTSGESAKKAGGPAKGGESKAGSGAEAKGERSVEGDRDFLMQKIQILQQRLTEFQQALSNILNAQHQTAMNAIGNIR